MQISCLAYKCLIKTFDNDHKMYILDCLWHEYKNNFIVISLNMVYWCIYVHMGMPERKVSNLLSHYSHYFWNKIFHWTWCSSIRVDCLIGAFRNPPVSSSLCCYYKRMPLHPAFYMGVEIWTQVPMLILLAPHSLQKWFLLSWTEKQTFTPIPHLS